MGDEDSQYTDTMLANEYNAHSCLTQPQKPEHIVPDKICSFDEGEDFVDGLPCRVIPQQKPNIIAQQRVEPNLIKTMGVQEQPPNAKHMEIARNRDFLMTLWKDNSTYLHLLAVETNDKRVIQQILTTLREKNSFDMDATYMNKFRHTPLLMSVLANNIDFTIALLNAGIRHDQFDWKGRTIFHYLAEGSPRAVKEIFKRHTFDFKATQGLLRTWDFDGKTPLFIATEENNTAAFQQFAMFGTGTDLLEQRDKKRDYTLMHMAAKKNNSYIIECLVRRGVNVNSKGWDEATPLHVAVSEGHIDAASTLLKSGADPTMFLRENSILGLIPTGEVEDKMHGLIMGYVSQAVYHDLLQYQDYSEWSDDEDSMSD